MIENPIPPEINPDPSIIEVGDTFSLVTSTKPHLYIPETYLPEVPQPRDPMRDEFAGGFTDSFSGIVAQGLNRRESWASLNYFKYENVSDREKKV